ncbi:hypothetical protein [Oerskovia turbata]
MGVDFPHGPESVGLDEVRARLVEAGWERDEQLDDPYVDDPYVDDPYVEDEWFVGGEVGFEAVVSSYAEGTVSVTFYSPLWSPDE